MTYKVEMPDFTKCTKSQKAVFWNVCKQSKKDHVMKCTLDNKACPAYEGLKSYVGGYHHD